MSKIRLYRKFYHVSPMLTAGSYSHAYNLIDPISISTEVRNAYSSSLIETPSTVVKESTGIYYVDLTPKLYSFNSAFELEWSVYYINNAPLRRLPTRFRLDPINIGSGIEIDYKTFKVDTDIEFRVIEIEVLPGQEAELVGDITHDADYEVN